MSDIFFDSFDHYTTPAGGQLKWQVFPSNNIILQGQGRNGKNALQVNNPPPQNTLAVPRAIIVMEGAYQTTSGFNGSIFLASGNAGSVSLSHVGDGRVRVNFNGNLSAPSAFVMFASTWYFLGASFTLVSDGVHVTVNFVIQANNSVILTGSIQINNSTNPATFDTYQLPAPGGGANALVDDFDVTDGEFLGDGVISCLFPRATGDLTQFVPLAVMPLRTPGSTINAGDPLHTSLVGLWAMNEGSGTTDLNLVDSTTATFVAGAGPTFPTWFTSPVSNVLERIQFGPGGVGRCYLNAGHASGLDHLTTSKITISIGLRWVNNNNSETGICFKYNAPSYTAGFQIWVVPSSGLIHFEVQRSVATLIRETIPFGGLTSGKWQQLTITWDGTGSVVASDVHIYIDGVECSYSSSVNGSGTLGDESGNDLKIGIDTNTNAFSGDMAYFAIYKGRILTTTEMATLNTTLPITQGDLTAPNWRYVNEWSPDFEDSKVQTDTAGNKDLYFFDLILGSPLLKGAQFLSLVAKSDAGAASVKNILKSGGVEMDGTEYFPSFPSYTYDREAYRKSTFTGVDWAVAEINALQYGIKRQT